MSLEKQEILDQKQEFLTFEEICKEWSAYIAGVGGITNILSVYMTGNRDRCLAQYKSCLVGEAHGFKDQDNNNPYDGCVDCYKASMNFFHLSNSIHNGPDNPFRNNTKEQREHIFERKKEEFVLHFNKEHRKCQ